MESAAATVLTRAVEMDTKEQYTMALLLYQEGVQILLNTVKGTMILKFACISFYFYGLFIFAIFYLLILSLLKMTMFIIITALIILIVFIY